MQNNLLLVISNRMTSNFYTEVNPKSEIFFSLCTKQMAKFIFYFVCKSAMFPYFGFLYHLFKLNIDPNENLKS